MSRPYSMADLAKLANDGTLAEMQTCKVVSQGPLRKESPHQKLTRLTSREGQRGGATKTPVYDGEHFPGKDVSSSNTEDGSPPRKNNATAISPAGSNVPHLPQLHNHAKEGTYQLYKLRYDDEESEGDLTRGNNGVPSRIEIQAIRAERSRQRFANDVAKMELNKKTKPPAPMSLPDLEEQAMKSIPDHLKRLRAGVGGKGMYEAKEDEDVNDTEPLPFVVDPIGEQEVKASLLGEIALTDREVVTNRRIRIRDENAEKTPRTSKKSRIEDMSHLKMIPAGGEPQLKMIMSGSGRAEARGRKKSVVGWDDQPQSHSLMSINSNDPPPPLSVPMLTMNTMPSKDSKNGSVVLTQDPNLEEHSYSKNLMSPNSASHRSKGSKSSRSFRGVQYPDKDAETLGSSCLGLGKEARSESRRTSTVFLLTSGGHVVPAPTKTGSRLLAVDSDDEKEHEDSDDGETSDESPRGDDATFMTRTRVNSIKRKKSAMSLSRSVGFAGSDACALSAREVSVIQKRELMQVAPEDFIRLRGEDRHAQTYRKGRYVVPSREPVAVHNSDHVVRFLAALKHRSHEFHESVLEELDRVRDAQRKFREQKAAAFKKALDDPSMSRVPADRLFTSVRQDLAEACRLKDFNGRLNVYREHINRLERHASNDFESEELVEMALNFTASVRKVVEKKKGLQDYDLFVDLCTKNGGPDRKTGKDHPVLPKDHVAIPAECLMLKSVSSFLGLVAPVFGIEATTYNHWLDGAKRRFEGRDFATEIRFRKVEMQLGRDLTTEIKFRLTIHTARGVNLQAFSQSAGAVNGKPPVFVKVIAERGHHITKASFSTIPKWDDTFNVHMFNEQTPVNFKLIIGDDEVASGFMMAARYKEQGEVLLKQQQNQAVIAQSATGASSLPRGRQTAQGDNDQAQTDNKKKSNGAVTARGAVSKTKPKFNGNGSTGSQSARLNNKTRSPSPEAPSKPAGPATSAATRRESRWKTLSTQSVPGSPLTGKRLSESKLGATATTADAGSDPDASISPQAGAAKLNALLGKTSVVVSKGPPQKGTVALAGSLVPSAEVIITVEVLTSRLVTSNKGDGNSGGVTQQQVSPRSQQLEREATMVSSVAKDSTVL